MVDRPRQLLTRPVITIAVSYEGEAEANIFYTWIICTYDWNSSKHTQLLKIIKVKRNHSIKHQVLFITYATTPLLGFVFQSLTNPL